MDPPPSEIGDKRLSDGSVFTFEILILFYAGCGFEGCSSQDVPVALQCLEEMLKKRRKQVQR